MPRAGGTRAGGALSRRARAYRTAHLVWGIAQLTALARVWASALGLPRRGSFWPAVGFLGVQGVGLLVGRGDCPLTPVQHRLGDPAPMFELVLPPRAAKAAIPVLAGVSLLGLVLAFRPR